VQDTLGATRLDSGISDDPTTWRVPNRAGQFDTVLDWWQHLRDVDDGLRDSIGSDADVDRVGELIEQARILLSDFTPTPGRTIELRNCVQELMATHKLSPVQVQRALALGSDVLSEKAVVSMLAARGRRSDDEAKLRAIEMLRAGSYTAAIAEETGLTYEQIRYLAATLGIDRKLSKDHIVAEAMRLFAEGEMKVVDIHRHLLTIPGGEHVKLNTVYQWRQRAHRSPEQRERVLQLVADGVPYPEIAEQTNVPVGTVKAWASRARLAAKAEAVA
jgi:transposase-like protein